MKYIYYYYSYIFLKNVRVEFRATLIAYMIFNAIKLNTDTSVTVCHKSGSAVKDGQRCEMTWLDMTAAAPRCAKAKAKSREQRRVTNLVQLNFWSTNSRLDMISPDQMRKEGGKKQRWRCRHKLLSRPLIRATPADAQHSRESPAPWEINLHDPHSIRNSPKHSRLSSPVCCRKACGWPRYRGSQSEPTLEVLGCLEPSSTSARKRWQKSQLEENQESYLTAGLGRSTCFFGGEGLR